MSPPPLRASRPSLWRGVLLAPLMLLATFYGFCALCLFAYNWAFPPMTMVQLQRRIEALAEEAPLEQRYQPVPMDRIAGHLPYAAVAAEDGRFFEHGGIDWEAVREAVEDYRNEGRRRGGSTITQQLVKNLFLTTHSTYWRKALELPLAYLAEGLLSKERILTLYLNVAEWDRGVYGAEAAAQHYYGIPAAELSRYQAAALAACLPNPRERTPQGMDAYARIILARMSRMGW